MSNPVISYGITDVGLQREHNEDCRLADDGIGLYAVADGMGGHAAGEVASARAIEVLRDFVLKASQDDEFVWPYGRPSGRDDLENALVTGIRLANREVWRLAREDRERDGMGTTIAAIHVRDYTVAVAHAGDSRVYRFHNDALELMTQDHTLVNEQVQRGILTPDMARHHPWKNIITRALGSREELEVEVSRFNVAPGDLLLLCSDGLMAGDDVEETAIAAAIRRHAGALEPLGRELVAMANDAGGSDNVTVVLVRFLEPQASGDAGAPRSDDEDTTWPMLEKRSRAGSSPGSGERAADPDRS